MNEYEEALKMAREMRSRRPHNSECICAKCEDYDAGFLLEQRALEAERIAECLDEGMGCVLEGADLRERATYLRGLKKA